MKNETLSKMHELIAKRLLEKLNDEECDPKFINAAIKFLKDNNITADIETNRSLQLVKEATETKVETLPFKN